MEKRWNSVFLARNLFQWTHESFVLFRHLTACFYTFLWLSSLTLISAYADVIAFKFYYNLPKKSGLSFLFLSIRWYRYIYVMLKCQFPYVSKHVWAVKVEILLWVKLCTYVNELSEHWTQSLSYFKDIRDKLETAADIKLTR